MIILFGSQKRVKALDIFENDVCGVCKTPNTMQMHEVSYWFTLFFIPLIKLRKEYFFICPACRAIKKIHNKDAKGYMQYAKEHSAVNRNVRAEAQAPQVQTATEAQPQAQIDVRALITDDIGRVMSSIKDASILEDSNNFNKLYNSIKNGLVNKYGNEALVESTMKEYFGI